MAIKCIDCKNCKSDVLTANAGAEYCVSDMWDRNDEDKDWLHDDKDFNEYVVKDRFCSEFSAL